MRKTRIMIGSAAAALALIGVTATTSMAAPAAPAVPTVDNWQNHDFTGPNEEIWVEPGACYTTTLGQGFSSEINNTGRDVTVWSNSNCTGWSQVISTGEGRNVLFYAWSVSD